MLKDLPHDPKEAHKEIINKLNEHTLEIKRHQEDLSAIKELNRAQDQKLEKISKDTSALVEFSKASNGFIKIMKWISRIVVWFSGVIAAVYTIYYYIFGGFNNE